MDTGKAGCSLKRVNGRRALDTGVQTEGSELVEGVDDAFAVVVEIQAKTGADRSFFVGRIDDGQPGREICFLLRPESGRVVRRPAGSELQKRFVHLSQGRGGTSLLVPRIRVDRGRDLLPILLVGGLQNGVPYSVGDSQVRTRSPAILNVPFIFICLEMPIDEGAIRIQAPGRPSLSNGVVGIRWSASGMPPIRFP